MENDDKKTSSQRPNILKCLIRLGVATKLFGTLCNRKQKEIKIIVVIKKFTRNAPSTEMTTRLVHYRNGREFLCVRCMFLTMRLLFNVQTKMQLTKKAFARTGHFF